MDELYVLWIGDESELSAACIDHLVRRGGWVLHVHDEGALRERFGVSSRPLDAVIVDARGTTDAVRIVGVLDATRAHSPAATIIRIQSYAPRCVDAEAGGIITVLASSSNALQEILASLNERHSHGVRRECRAEVVAALRQTLRAAGLPLGRQHRAVVLMRILAMTARQMAKAIRTEETTARAYLAEARGRLGWRSISDGAGMLLRELGGDLQLVVSDVLCDEELASRILDELCPAKIVPQIEASGSRGRA